MTIDRKALVREYKETPRTIGVGAVRHVASGRTFVFSSVDLPAMLNRQRAQLRLRGHRNRALQADWDANGEAAFAFEVLDTLEPRDEPGWTPADDLKALETLWMEKLRPYAPHGYNKPPSSSSDSSA